jgi:hypothetical protein
VIILLSSETARVILLLSSETDSAIKEKELNDLLDKNKDLLVYFI